MDNNIFCPNCGGALTFEDASRLAKDNGVGGNAVMCPRCRKIFNVSSTPNGIKILNESTDYNSSSSSTQQVPQSNTNSMSSFQKRVKRDKQIIIGASIVVAILIIGSLIAIPSLVYDDGYAYYDTDLDNYNDISSSSGITVKVTDAHEDDDGWFFVWGKILPSSTDTNGLTAITKFYDSSGLDLASDYDDDLEVIGGTVLLGGAELESKEISTVEIAIVDNDNNIVAKTTYHVH